MKNPDIFDIFDLGDYSKEKSGAGFLKPLGRSLDNFPNHNYFCYLEITLNYPRNAMFKRLQSDAQISLYMGLLEYMLYNTSLYRFVVYKNIQFEKCMDGHTHMHASVKFNFTEPYTAVGLIEQLVKCYLTQLPLKYNYYNEQLMRYDFKRYRCPSIVVQFVDAADIDRIEKWNNYIIKDLNAPK